MTKRNLATVLWLLMGWTLGLMLAATAGLPSLTAPALGVLFAAIVHGDPSGRIWHDVR